LPRLAHPPDTASDAQLAAEHAATFKRLSKLPHFQTSGLNLLILSTDSEAALPDIEKIFLSDPALAADLLLVANSAEFGFRSRVETVRHALTLLGLDRVRSLASAIALQLYVQKVQHIKDLRSVWAHSVATAVIAESVGNMYALPAMYTAGLTHDLGRLGLILIGGGEYAQHLSRVFTDVAEANALEKALFGMNHCEAGAFLAKTWGFPASLRSHMADHHEPPEGSLANPRYLIQVACRLADSLGFLEVRRLDVASTPPLPERLRNRAELTPELLYDQITRRMATFGTGHAGGPDAANGAPPTSPGFGSPSACAAGPGGSSSPRRGTARASWCAPSPPPGPT
jgi:HD-like signal output (HDOD) protein